MPVVPTADPARTRPGLTATVDRTGAAGALDPDGVHERKAAADHDLLVGGPHLAAQALDAGLVDEVVLWVWPIVLGHGRNPALAAGGRSDLVLVDEQRIGDRFLQPRYRVR